MLQDSVVEVLQEVTDWGDSPVTNGEYHLNAAGQLVGYRPNTDSPVKFFSKPMKLFSKTRRKFKKIS